MTRNKKITINCYHCNSEFEIQPYRLKTAKRLFCSKECNNEWQKSSEYCEIHKNRKKKPDIQVTCVYCGNEFLKRPQNVSGKNFCNNECRNNYNSERIIKEMSKDKIRVECLICGKEKHITESKYKINKYHFCSFECYKEWRINNIPKGKDSPFYNRLIRYCGTCNKELEVTPSNDKRNDNNFCSQECYWKWVFNESKTINLNSKPQIIINDLLTSININYDNEFYIEPYFVDNCLFVNNIMLFIEVNGAFWHVDSRKYSTITHDRQLKSILRDNEKRLKVLNKYNINILYLWEEEIINDVELCKYIIKEYINNNGVLKNYHSFNYLLENDNLKLKDNVIIPYMDWSYGELENIIKVIS